MSNKRQYTVFGDGEDEERSWEVETLADGSYRIHTPDGRIVEVDAYSPAGDQLHLLLEGRSVDVSFSEQPDGLQLQVDGERHTVEVFNQRELRMRAAGAGSAAGGSPELTSPMAGQIVKIVADEGQVVEAGEPMVVVEAMKMENDLKAHRDGVVADIEVEAGQAVEVGDVLLSIRDEEDDE